MRLIKSSGVRHPESKIYLGRL